MDTKGVMREKVKQYDIIGDVHGRWDKLEPLLTKLGYKRYGLGYGHPEGRIALFLGDLIDPKGYYPNGTREVLLTVKAMCDAGHAHCILGNHEYNFVAYHTPDGQNCHLRPHGEKNDRMHAGTHAALDKHPGELEKKWLPWLKTLPFYLDLPELRIVHACWHPEYIRLLKGKTLADGNLLRESSINGTPEYRAIETVLKGVELPMPTGHYFYDHQNNKRTEFRARWWDKDAPSPTAKSMLFPAKEEFPDTPLNAEDVDKLPGYHSAEKPVFIGHYYKPADSPLEPEAENLYCLDFSAATEGSLTAYVWDGPHTLLESDLLVSSAGDRSEDTNKPGGASEADSDINGFHSFMGAARSCAMSMMENAAYIQEALPTIEIEEHYQERIKVVCEALIGTKHDILHEIMDLEELLNGRGDEAKCFKMVERMMLWLQEPIATLHDTVSMLREAPEAALPFMLVAESGVNIMNAFNSVADAHDALRGQ